MHHTEELRSSPAQTPTADKYFTIGTYAHVPRNAAVAITSLATEIAAILCPVPGRNVLPLPLPTWLGRTKRGKM